VAHEDTVNRTSRIYVAGGDTPLGAALLERLRAAGYERLVGTPPDEPDLTAAGPVDDFFAEARPEYVFVAAGESGGIYANRTRPADLMRHNLLVTAHVIQAAHAHGVAKLLYLASSCSYPRMAPQPLRVDALLTGSLEPTSEAYALAKLAGLRLCQAFREQYGASFITAVPANAFGPHDDFRPGQGHVISGLIRKLHEAKRRGDRQVAVWGTGTPRREFIYFPDLAEACLFVMKHYDEPTPINLGGGPVLSIAETAQAIAEVVGYRGRLCFDARQPDGAPLKALDSSPLRALGWRPRTDFRTALLETYAWFRRHVVKEDIRDVPTFV
jgi:GDP-L-fucose synthase